MPAEHALIVPPEGLLEIVHGNNPINIGATLRLRTDGVLVHVQHPKCTASYLVNDHGQLNPRARGAFQFMTGASMMFTGPVMFTEVDEHLVGEVVGMLSLSDQVL
jgi:hypothetical protein